jgi:hypothetical protein
MAMNHEMQLNEMKLRHETEMAQREAQVKEQIAQEEAARNAEMEQAKFGMDSHFKEEAFKSDQKRAHEAHTQKLKLTEAEARARSANEAKIAKDSAATRDKERAAKKKQPTKLTVSKKGDSYEVMKH